MKLVVFHPEAQEELLQEALYYNERSPTLGVRLINQIHEAIDLAAKMPGIGSPYVAKTRRVFPRIFLSLLFTKRLVINWWLSQLPLSNDSRPIG